MIKFKNINNLYGFNCLNIKVVKMKNETKKQTSPIESANSNVNLKTHLTLALKNTSSIMKVLLPKIAVSVKDLIIEYKKLTEKNTDTDEKNNQIQMKALREHCYSLVGYNRKTDPNSAFEMVCTRAVKLGLMMTDHATEFDVDSKNSQIFVMSKIATPFKVEKLEGQVSATKKIPNNEENLVEVNTGVIDRVYNVKYGNPNKRKAKTKDEKVELTFKDNAKSFYKLFNKALDYSKKKDVRFFDLVDEETMKQLSLIDSLFNGENYKVMRSFSLDYQVSVEGELEKSSIGKNKKIA